MLCEMKVGDNALGVVDMGDDREQSPNGSSNSGRVSEVVTAFVNSGELHEAKRLVTEQAPCSSEKPRNYTSMSCPKDTRAVLTFLRQSRRSGGCCRTASATALSLAFANFFADQFPDPISDTAALALSQHMAPDGVAQLVADHPQFLPEFQPAFAAAEFVAALVSEMLTPEAKANRARRVVLGRAALRLVDLR